jgi:hypothetical protein
MYLYSYAFIHMNVYLRIYTDILIYICFQVHLCIYLGSSKKSKDKVEIPLSNWSPQLTMAYSSNYQLVHRDVYR